MTARVRRGLAAVLLLLPAIACRTPADYGTVDLAQPGWQLQHGQAVWRARAEQTELAGELLFARHGDGRRVLQFSKTPFLLVSARLQPNQWQLEFPPQQRAYRGHGKPPARLGWLQLCHAITGDKLSGDWRFERRPDGQWRLENASSGERIEGYLSP